MDWRFKKMDNPMMPKAPDQPGPIAHYACLLRSGHFTNMPRHYMRRGNPMDYLVWLVVDGKGFLNTKEGRFEMGPGDLALLRPHTPQEYGADPQTPWSIYWVHFDGELARGLFESIRQFGGPTVHLGVDPKIRDRFQELVLLHESAALGTHPRVDCELLGLLSQILQRLRRLAAQGNDMRLETGPIEAWVQEHLNRKITLEDLAGLAHLSTPHFCRLFRQAYGQSPMQYIIRLRLGRACHLLRETGAKVADVAQSVGYEDPYYFSRIFSQVVGVSPRQFRQGKGNYLPMDRSFSTTDVTVDERAEQASKVKTDPGRY